MCEEKDYSLLRPFDLEAAKRGEVVCWYYDGERLEYVGTATSDGYAGCFKWLDGDNAGTYEIYESEDIRMAPLCWVEERPVYKGDVLWHKIGNYFVTVEHPGDAEYFTCEKGTFEYRYLTWTQPKVKREGWVNIYRRSVYGQERAPDGVYATEQIANEGATNYRIACIRIEWEEPAN